MKVGEPHHIHFSIYAQSDDAPVTGLVDGDFTKVVVRDKAVVADTITIFEVDNDKAKGLYVAEITGAAAGKYHIKVTVDKVLYRPSEFEFDVQCVEQGVLDLVDFDTIEVRVEEGLGDYGAAKESTLTASQQAGTLNIPGKTYSPSEVLELHKKNSYTPLSITLGAAFAAFFDSVNKVWFTMKKKKGDATALVDIEGTVSDIVNAVVGFNLTPSHTDLTPGKYWAEIQIKSSDDTVIKSAQIREVQVIGIVKE